MGQLDPSRQIGCELCEGDGGALVARTPEWRIIRASDVHYPAFYRVIWNQHVAEFTDLPATARVQCMDAVALVESLMREHLAPTKINLASLGNVVPHLHWHVIARFADDRHFPQPIWGTPQREGVGLQGDVEARLHALDAAIAAAARGRSLS